MCSITTSIYIFKSSATSAAMPRTYSCESFKASATRGMPTTVFSCPQVLAICALPRIALARTLKSGCPAKRKQMLSAHSRPQSGAVHARNDRDIEKLAKLTASKHSFRLFYTPTFGKGSHFALRASSQTMNFILLDGDIV